MKKLLTGLMFGLMTIGILSGCGRSEAVDDAGTSSISESIASESTEMRSTGMESIENEIPAAENTEAENTEAENTDAEQLLAGVSLEGGSGKAWVTSPAELVPAEDGYTARICFSSPNYDYLVLDGETYLPVNDEGNSVFEIPVPSDDCSLAISADTTAMSQPHLIDYTLVFSPWDGTDAETDVTGEAQGSANDSSAARAVPAEIDGCAHTGCMDLTYARQFAVDYYEEDLALVTIAGEDQFLLLPEGYTLSDEAGEALPEGMTILQLPLDHIYLVSSQTMDMFAACGAMDTMSWCALEKDHWSVTEAAEAMDAGDLVYAGKYSMPDYELLTGGGCRLAIENTMVLHSPEVVEALETLGIPVLIDHASYEDTAEGRMEWIRLYGLLTGHEEEAEAAFKAQAAAFERLTENTSEGTSDGPTAAFFYVTTSGMVSVRNSSDYIPAMIRQAGGSYIFEDLGETSASASQTIQMETFYAAAKDADYLIYNGTIAGEISSLEDFLALNPLFANMKAVQEGHVYCARASLYQSSMELGDFVTDLSRLFAGEEEDFSFLYRLE